MRKKTLEELLSESVNWCHAEKRWPTSTDTPVPASTAARRFGGWEQYKIALRKSWIEENGVPEWEKPTQRRTTPVRDVVSQEFSAAFEAAIENLNALPALKPRTPANVEPDASELHLVISDVHVGETVDANLCANLCGPDGYNFEVFSRRADLMEERVLFFKKMYGKAFSINKLVVNFIGDIVTGENIFQGQQLYVDKIVIDQVIAAAHRFANMFRNWAAHFAEVEIIAVWGNHGRIGRHGELHPRDNFDYITYVLGRELTRDQQNLKWIISDGPILVIRHGDYNWLVHHGDTLRGAGGTKGNFMGLERKLQDVSSMADTPIHYTVSGHMHRSASISLKTGGRIIQNGSWVGGSDFSVNCIGDSQIPAQKLLLFHPRKGVHSETDIILGDRIRLQQDDNRVFTSNYTS